MADTEPPTTMSYPLPPQYTGAPGQQLHDSTTSNGQANPSHMPPPPLPPVVIPQNSNPIPTAISSPGNVDLNSSLSPSSGSGSSSVRRSAPEPNKRALYVGGLDPRVTEDVLRQIFETTGHVQNVKIIPDKNMGAVSEIGTPFIAFYLFPAYVVVHCKVVVWKYEKGFAPRRRASAMSRKRVTHSCLFPSRHSHTSTIFSPPFSPSSITCFAAFAVLILAFAQSKGFNYGFIEYDDPGAAERAMSTLNGRRVHQAVGQVMSNAYPTG